MAAPPYMKLYVADYLGDTHHLGALEHGAYLLLLMAMWRAGGSLPAADANLAKLARCTPDQWAEVKEAIMPFFKRQRSRLTHKRLSEELAKYENTSGKRSEAGKRGAAEKASKNKGATQAIASDAASNCRHNQNHSYREEPPVTPQGGLDLIGEEPERIDEPKAAFEAWNELAKRLGLPVAQVLDDNRRRAIRKRLEVGGLDLWRRALAGVEASAFLRGQRAGGDGRTFKADLTFVCQAKSFAKLVDGAYGADAKPEQPAHVPAEWRGPAEIFDAIAFLSRGLAVGYLARCQWQDVPERAVIAPSGAVFDRLKRDAEHVFRDLNVKLILAEVGRAA